ncbi:MAG: arylsulfatase [Planctomycetota bacterium]|nr:arylsulfatase [Planctomycetota bacterium]
MFILADDLGYGDLSCYGQPHFRTPNIDRLAAEGMKFTQFYAGSTVCAPSRCTLMTGLHTGHCLIRGNAKLNLRPEDLTVAEVLKDAGYTTGLFGKWGIGHEGSTGVPTKQGFDEFFGYLDQHHAHNYYPAFLHGGEERVPLKNVVPGDGPFGDGVATEKVQYSADLIHDEALAFVDRHAKESFFLYYAATLPHANNEGKKEGMEIPDLGPFAEKDWPEPQKGLAAMIAKLDTNVGQLLDKLAEQGVAENTIVMFTSDNGPHNEGGNDADYFDSNGPLRGTKRAPYDGGIRVPFIVRWPGKVAPGSESEHVGYFGDLMATAAEVAGTHSPRNLDSLSFVPALLVKSEQPKHEFLYWEFYEQGSFQAIRMGDWKAVVRPIGGEMVELYNITDDIEESHDMAAEHPDLVAKALEIFRREHAPSPHWSIPSAKKAKGTRAGSGSR